ATISCLGAFRTPAAKSVWLDRRCGSHLGAPRAEGARWQPAARWHAAVCGLAFRGASFAISRGPLWVLVVQKRPCGRVDAPPLEQCELPVRTVLQRRLAVTTLSSPP